MLSPNYILKMKDRIMLFNPLIEVILLFGESLTDSIL